MYLHMELQFVTLVQQQATVGTIQSEISSKICLHMQFQFLTQIWQKVTVETLRDDIPSMSLHMVLQIVCRPGSTVSYSGDSKLEISSMMCLHMRPKLVALV